MSSCDDLYELEQHNGSSLSDDEYDINMIEPDIEIERAKEKLYITIKREKDIEKNRMNRKIKEELKVVKNNENEQKQ
jgi:hypothetical protein